LTSVSWRAIRGTGSRSAPAIRSLKMMIIRSGCRSLLTPETRSSVTSFWIGELTGGSVSLTRMAFQAGSATMSASVSNVTWVSPGRATLWTREPLGITTRPSPPRFPTRKDRCVVADMPGRGW
jgi:hypothetical protein